MPEYSKEEINEMVRRSLMANGIKVTAKTRTAPPGEIVETEDCIILKKESPVIVNKVYSVVGAKRRNGFTVVDQASILKARRAKFRRKTQNGFPVMAEKK